MNFSDFSLKSKLLLGNIITIFLLFVLCAVVWRSIKTMDSTSAMVEHTYKVIDLSNGLVNAMVDQETGLRGFAIGGQKDYLEPYYAGLEHFSRYLSEVKQLTSDNPAQQRRFDGVAADATEWKSYAEKVIALRSDIAEGEAVNQTLRTLIDSGVGKQKMDGIRAFIDQGAYGTLGPRVITAMINMETGLRGFMLNRDEAFLEPYAAGRQEIDRLLRSNTGIMGQLRQRVFQWIEEYAEVAIGLVRDANQYKTMNDLYAFVAKKEGKTFMDGIRAKVEEIVEVEETLMSQRKASADGAGTLALQAIGIGGLVAAIVTFGFGALISKSISVSISKAVDAAHRLSEGDLSFNLKIGNRNNEVGRLLSALQTTASSFREIVGSLDNASNQLTDASDQFGTITSKTSEGAEEQKHMTDQVAVAMNQMSISVQEVARNVVSAAEFARDAHSEAENGLQVIESTKESITSLEAEIQQTSERLTGLAEQANNIGGILDVIRDIADQTNLLALNAAIEAARAGEQGRGFAVVADEVRSLAKRTQDSTSEIQELIERLQHGTTEVVASMEKSAEIVGGSVREANKSGEAFNTISESIAKINDMNTQSANAAEEQSATAEEINKNVVAVNKISDQSAEYAQHGVASSQSLNVLSDDFRAIVGQFKVN
ncbi:CHASE3 domain-containing protein [Thaumasiovibrio subtropicus]|uniref:CHASE3 domain-containing protein n=1 Tax=Thaumasiovibrio subtropicus TaxID=1891207 RepID=UPI000B354E0F|nr:CHASE3 domain-containing protein [Thaumasiovibrio subtropicus]